MRRTPVIVALLFAMLWQSVALARMGSTVNAFADVAHTALHWQETAHHHHEDGSYHPDDSKESAQHLVCDHVCATIALPVAASHHFPLMASAAPEGLHAIPVPGPTLDGLLRPPRLRT